jgi:Domain of unknown function (DUF1996)
VSDGKHGYGALMAIMAALLVALIALAMAAKEAEAFTPVKGAPLGFGVRCDPTVKTAQEDPMVYPGQHDVGHVHDFFGAQNINPDSRPDSIRQGSTSCAHSGDKAAYWVPAALNTSVYQMIAYYKPAPGKDNSPLNPYSEHLQMIAGSVPMDGDETPSSHVLWGCQGEASTSNRPVDCGAGNHAKVEVVFPNCQAVNSDGPVDDSTNHRSHMAYSDEQGHCPDSHPRKVVQLHVHVIYQQSDARNINFSVPWYDFRADIMNGWDETVLKQAIDECITGERYGCQRISDEDQSGTVEPVIPGPNNECPGAEVVNTTTGTGNMQSPPFGIEGDRFQITITVVPTSRDPSLADVTAFIVNAENNQDVTSINKEGSGTETSIVNAGPGRFYLDLKTANADYAVVVEDCVGSDNGSGDGSGGGGGGGDGGGGNNDHNNRHHHNRHHHNRHHHNRHHHNRFHQNAAHIQYERTVDERVIKETIPDKGTLANTGGSPLILLACVVLLSTGLLLGRSVIRRAL